MFRIVGGDPEIFERRAKVQDSYQELRVHHPSLPPDLHPFQADITAAAIDQQDRQHILSCLPTGNGKTLPMLITGALLPAGMTTMIIAPLTTIKQQIEDDCRLYGISALVGDQIPINSLAGELRKRPQILVVSAEFLASIEVRDVLLNVGLASDDQRPVVCIDECQVLDSIYGWTGFRESYSNSTWIWLVAAFDPKILMSSASLSEEALKRACATLEIPREDIKVFFKHPRRTNIFQQVRNVIDFSTRLSDESLGFLLPLAASGRKIQVFCATMDLTVKANRWAKRRFREAGINAPVSMITGNLPISWKAAVMEKFRDGTSGVLFCTDAASMGTNVTQLCIGVSLGLPKTRWKLVQVSGRVGRQVGDKGIFITVAPAKQGFRVSPQEREEFNCVKTLFSSQKCINQGIYETFTISRPFVTYEETEVDERCVRCWCCSVCSTECAGRCGRGGGVEDHDEAALRALGIDPADVANAEASRRAFVMESRREYGSGEEGGNEEDLENDEDDNVGEEEEE